MIPITLCSSLSRLTCRWVCIVIAVVFSGPAGAAQYQTFITPDKVEISYLRYPAAEPDLLIWLPSEAGWQESEQQLAAQLAGQGYEVWQVDLLEARFLPATPSSLDQIPVSDISALIDHARQQQFRQIHLLSSGRGILPLLRGLHAWQLQHPASTDMPNLILLSPKFYYETPDPGQPARLLPIVTHTNARIFILQPMLSPWRWKLEQTIPALQRSGSDVFLQLLPGVRDRFYFRPDATEYEQHLASRLPVLLDQAARYLNAWPSIPRSVQPVTTDLPALPAGKKDRELRPFAGDPTPPALQLSGLDHRRYDLAEYRDQVVLVNFWASWCPPCVHEMPSMQRLQQRLAQRAFKILAVNMAEERATIEEFLRSKVNVTFPILLDSDGYALKRWEVFAFPTSYVIDKQGKIRYALFGSVDWEQQDIIEKIKQLLNE